MSGRSFATTRITWTVKIGPAGLMDVSHAVLRRHTNLSTRYRKPGGLAYYVPALTLLAASTCRDVLRGEVSAKTLLACLRPCQVSYGTEKARNSLTIDVKFLPALRPFCLFVPGFPSSSISGVP